MNFKDITSYEKACEALGKSPDALPDYSKADASEGEIKFGLASFKLQRIIRALSKKKNGKYWVPEPENIRHYPWMWWKKDASKPSGSGLSLDVVISAYSGTFVASRLCCEEEEIAEFCFNQFIDLWEDFIIFHP